MLGINQTKQDLLQGFVQKYFWWEMPEKSHPSPERVIAQVMNLGDYEDVQVMVNQLGNKILVDVLERAEIGQFNERSWHYWHYRLGLARLGTVPPMPERKLA